MAISESAGQPGPPEDKGVKETKSRSTNYYGGTVNAGFSLKGGATIDDLPVKPEATVHAGKSAAEKSISLPPIGKVQK